MTNEELIADLKEYIRVTVSRPLADTPTKDNIIEMYLELRWRLEELTGRVNAIHAAIGDTLKHSDTVDDADRTKLDDHERSA